VDPRDLAIEREAQVGRLAAANAEAISILHEAVDPLLPLPVPEDEERNAPALGLDSLLQLARRLRGHGTTCHVRSIGTRLAVTRPGPAPSKSSLITAARIR
jgi:hypothetical protein